MNQRYCSLIVIGPGAPRTFKLNFSRRTATTIGLMLLFCFLVAVVMGYTFPEQINESHRAQLEAENRALKAEALTATIGIQKLDEKLAELEEKSKRIMNASLHGTPESTSHPDSHDAAPESH